MKAKKITIKENSHKITCNVKILYLFLQNKQ